MEENRIKLAIVGTRTFNDYELMRLKLSDLTGIELIISGGEEGADTLARRYAKEHNIEIVEFLPNWDQYGKAAGPIRNEMIVKACTHIVLFWDGKSPGTKTSLEFAKKHRKRYRLVQYQP